ncbi:hypothetical protein Aduo_001203 [Ancylostoma duodenale]
MHADKNRMKKRVEQFKQERLLKAVEERKGMKKHKRDLLFYRNNLKALSNKNGNAIESNKGVDVTCEELYTELLSSQSEMPPPLLPQRNERPSEFLVSGV